MKYSMFLVATSALLAAAGPLKKRAMTTEWETEVVTVTVTEDIPAPTAAVFVETKKVTSAPAPPPPAPKTVIKVQPTSSAPPPPPPPPKTTLVVKPKPTTAPPPPPAPKPAPAPSNNLGDYENTMLKQHNLHRSNHSAPALEWDSTLAQYAENTANTCVFEHDM